MGRWSKIIFYGFLLAVFLIEGLGIFDRQIALYAVYLMPLFLILPLFFQHKPLFFPKKINILFLLFLLISFLSLFSSINIERSFYFLVYYLSVFLIFNYVYNFKEELCRGVVTLIFVIAFIFLFDSLILISPLSHNLSFLIPQRDYQFVYQTYSTNHPLGIFLIIPILLLLLPLMEGGSSIFLVLFLILFPALLLSYFRSSYVTFIVAFGFLFVKDWHKKVLDKKRVVLFSILLLFSVLLLFSLTSYEKPVFLVSNINLLLQKSLYLNPKSFFSGRNEFWISAIKGSLEHPIFGVGIGNFYNLSLKYAQSGSFADSSSLFLDFFAETGFFGGLIFLLFFIAIALSGRNIFSGQNLWKKMVYFTFLFLFIFFQSGPGKHYSLILLFFILGALVYQEKDNHNLIDLFFALAIIIVIICQSIVMGRLYLDSGHYSLSFYRFPLQKDVYQPLIDQTSTSGDNKKAGWLMTLYGRFFSGETESLNYLGNLYENAGNLREADYFYERSFYWFPFQSFSLVEKIYQLKKALVGQKEAQRFVEQFLAKYYDSRHRYYWPDFEENIAVFCQKEKGACRL